MLLLYIKKFVNFTTNFLKLYSPEEKYLYKIEEIDETLNQVTISCRGKNISLVSSINEIGYDQTIVTLLPHITPAGLDIILDKIGVYIKLRKKTILWNYNILTIKTRITESFAKTGLVIFFIRTHLMV